MNGTTVVFKDVSLSLGGLDILDNISLTARPGEIHAIVGPNGGGKTSLVRALLGQLPHTGTIRFESEKSPIVGYAPQVLEYDRSLPLTVADVMVVMRQRRPAFLGVTSYTKKAALEALGKLGMDHMWNSRFGGLSGGERQRVLIAQALVPSPDLLILDEATSNLDQVGSTVVEALMREVSNRHTTILWINHDWKQVRRVATTVTGINRKVMFSGAPSKVMPDVSREVA